MSPNTSHGLSPDRDPAPGRHVPAEEAHRLGIIDELVLEGDELRQAAIAMARRVACTGSMLRENQARRTRPPSVGYAGHRLIKARQTFTQTKLRKR